MSNVKLAHASISEKGTIRGTAGDQTGKEVCIRTWYKNSKGWVLIRCKDPAMRPFIAEAAEAAAKNDNIGYDQIENQTLWKDVEDKGFDPAKADEPTETDCARLVRLCCQYACEKVGNGVKIPDFYTASEASVLKKTGLFEVLTASKYTEQDDWLIVGDILCTRTKGHTAVVISNGSKAGGGSSGSTASSGNSAYNGKGIGTAVAKKTMNVRAGAGTGNRSLGTIKKGTTVEVLEKLSNGWYKIVWAAASCGYAFVSNSGGKYFTYTANAPTSSAGAASTTKKAESAKFRDKALNGTYTTTAELNMRTGPGTGKSIMLVIPKGAKVKNYGYYSKDADGDKWLYVAYNGATGFCSIDYLKK